MSGEIDPLFANHPEILAMKKQTQDFINSFKLEANPMDESERVAAKRYEAVSTSSGGRCQKCDCSTKGEEALVGGQIWCHTCADDAPVSVSYQGGNNG